MEQPRFVETGGGTFFGEYLNDQVIPQDHFLRILRKVVDWEYFTKRLLKIYKGQGVVGRPPGFGRCRYIGKARYTIQSFLMAIVLNLKRMVKLITGVN